MDAYFNVNYQQSIKGGPSVHHMIVSPIAEMRMAPSRNAEIVSQAFFSENILILDESKNWVKIKTVVDQYPGWTKKESVAVSKVLNKDSYVSVNRLAAHVYHKKDTIYGPILTLPYESLLPIAEPEIVMQDSKNRWIAVFLPNGDQGYIQSGDVIIGKEKMNRQEICSLSLSFLGLPYTWGGRSSFGYDCSGFVQMLYRQMHIALPRDSKDQFLWEGFERVPVDNLMPGDLIFFGFSSQQIRHVGLSLGSKSFIHAVAVTENAPYIRVSSIKDMAWDGTGYYPFSSGRTLKLNADQTED